MSAAIYLNVQVSYRHYRRSMVAVPAALRSQYLRSVTLSFDYKETWTICGGARHSRLGRPDSGNGATADKYLTELLFLKYRLADSFIVGVNSDQPLD